MISEIMVREEFDFGNYGMNYLREFDLYIDIVLIVYMFYVKIFFFIYLSFSKIDVRW